MGIDNKILCVSGGIDSFVAWHFLGKPRTIFFDTQTTYSEKEKAVVLKLFPDVIIDYTLYLKGCEVGDKAYIHQRNLLFAAAATKYADHVIIAGLKDDSVSDKTPRAFELMTRTLTECGGRPHSVSSPFWKMTKEDIVKWFLDRHPGSGRRTLLETTSCYHQTEHYCGYCPSCFRKYIALKVNGINLHFLNDPIAYDYRERALKGEFVKERNEAILKVLEEDESI